MTNRIFPDKGAVLIDGKPGMENDPAQSNVFLISESTLHPSAMRVAGAFRWARAFYPRFNEDYAMGLLRDFGLNPKAKISGLSIGYRSIFKLVLALSVNVPYVLLNINACAKVHREAPIFGSTDISDKPFLCQ